MTPLRPPTDPDNYRVQAGRFGDRFYTDPLPADDEWPATNDDDIYPAISTVKKATGQDWSRAMAKRLAKAPSQLVEIGNIESEFERKERLNLLSDSGLDQASGRGTIVHAHAEALLANRVPIYQMNDVVRPYIRTLEHFFAAYNPELVAAEFVAIHRTLNRGNVKRGNKFFGFGGTGDAVVMIDGELWLVDWKSRAEDSEHKAYPEEGAQVAAYGRADYWIVGDDTSVNGAKRIEPLDLAGGLIVSIKPDSYECFPINLDEGFEYWRDLHAWWQARRSERQSIGRKWAPRVAPDSADTSSLVAAVDQSNRVDESVDGHPTPASNRAAFEALTEPQKMIVRERFSKFGLNPNRPETAGRVAAIIRDVADRPTIREMQEQRAEQIAEHASPPQDHLDVGTPMLEAEGGEASDEMMSEARVMFDMVIGDDGRAWTGFRVTEANNADVSFQVSKLRSMRRAHLYLALCRWATFRGSTLMADEAEGNIEFRSMLFMIDGCEDGNVQLGHRLGMLNYEQAEQFATLVQEVVQSETGEQPATETEVNQPQPASE